MPERGRWQHRSGMTIRGGQTCEQCGLKGHDHTKKRVSYENGTWGYRYLCPLPGER